MHTGFLVFNQLAVQQLEELETELSPLVKPLRAFLFLAVAQLVEHVPWAHEVAGSSPASQTIFKLLLDVV